MRILFITHSFNSLAQRLHVELREQGHEVSVEFDINDEVTLQAAELFRPDLVLAPFLKRRLPDALTSRCICLVVHPGPEGDRGPAALDHAILDQRRTWGVTVLQATADYDAGPVWASAAFAMRNARKSSLYLNEVAGAATEAVLEAIERIDRGESPRNLDATTLAAGWRGPVPSSIRAIDWARDDTATVLRKIASADGMPGCPAVLGGKSLRLFNAREAKPVVGARAGSLIARSGDSVGVATRDGAVWVGHMLDRQAANPFKLPAARALEEESAGLPAVSASSPDGFQDISYTEHGKVGILTFAFYNGAMGTTACQLLLAAYRDALKRDTSVLVLCGSTDHWSNGLDLNAIEAAASPADESMANIRPWMICRKRSSARPTGSPSRRSAAMPGPAACSSPAPPTKSGCAPASFSIRTTRTWAISTVRNSGPIFCRVTPVRKMPRRSTPPACRWARRKLSGSAWPNACSMPALSFSMTRSPKRPVFWQRSRV